MLDDMANMMDHNIHDHRINNKIRSSIEDNYPHKVHKSVHSQHSTLFHILISCFIGILEHDHNYYNFNIMNSFSSSSDLLHKLGRFMEIHYHIISNWHMGIFCIFC